MSLLIQSSFLYCIYSYKQLRHGQGYTSTTLDNFKCKPLHYRNQRNLQEKAILRLKNIVSLKG